VVSPIRRFDVPPGSAGGGVPGPPAGLEDLPADPVVATRLEVWHRSRCPPRSPRRRSIGGSRPRWEGRQQPRRNPALGRCRWTSSSTTPRRSIGSRPTRGSASHVPPAKLRGPRRAGARGARSTRGPSGSRWHLRSRIRGASEHHRVWAQWRRRHKRNLQTSGPTGGPRATRVCDPRRPMRCYAVAALGARNAYRRGRAPAPEPRSRGVLALPGDTVPVSPDSAGWTFEEVAAP
jgi:hypothetical protein